MWRADLPYTQVWLWVYGARLGAVFDDVVLAEYHCHDGRHYHEIPDIRAFLRVQSNHRQRLSLHRRRYIQRDRFAHLYNWWSEWQGHNPSLTYPRSLSHLHAVKANKTI